MQPTNPRDAVELLEVFRIGITNKVMDTQRVIDWADAIIEQDAAPADFVIELAMCGRRNLNGMISLLNNYIGERKPNVAGRVTLGLLYHKYTAGKIDLYRVVSTMDWLIWNSDLTEEEQNLMSGVDDEYSMVVEGVIKGSVAAIADYVLRFLSFYQTFHLEDRAAWAALNVSVPEQVKAFYDQLRIS